MFWFAVIAAAFASQQRAFPRLFEPYPPVLAFAPPGGASPSRTKEEQLIEQLTAELKKERNEVTRLNAKMRDMESERLALLAKTDKLSAAANEKSFDPRPVLITQVLLARAAASSRGEPLPEAMEKKLTGWELKISPTVRAANELVRAKKIDWLAALKQLDGTGKTADLLTFRESAELVKELSAFALELHALTSRTGSGGRKP